MDKRLLFVIMLQQDICLLTLISRVEASSAKLYGRTTRRCSEDDKPTLNLPAEAARPIQTELNPKGLSDTEQWCHRHSLTTELLGLFALVLCCSKMNGSAYSTVDADL